MRNFLSVDSATPPTSEPKNSASIKSEIEAEIADHLASLEEELRRRGTPTHDAALAARERFGDEKQVLRSCWWIQMREEIVMRTATVTLLTFIALSLGMLAFTGWKAQANMADQVARLTEQLQRMNEVKPTVLPAPAPTTVSITGKVFDGSPNKPVPDLPIYLIKHPGTEVSRMLYSDKEGKFSSGPLEPAMYTTVAKLPLPKEVEKYWRTDFRIQQKPIPLYESGGSFEQDIDLSYLTNTVLVQAESRLGKVSQLLREVNYTNWYWLISRTGTTTASNVAGTPAHLGHNLTKKSAFALDPTDQELVGWPIILSDRLNASAIYSSDFLSQLDDKNKDVERRVQLPSGEYVIGIHVTASNANVIRQNARRVINVNSMERVEIRPGTHTDILIGFEDSAFSKIEKLVAAIKLGDGDKHSDLQTLLLKPKFTIHSRAK